MSSNATPLWIDTLWIALICKKQRCDLRGGDNLTLSLSLSLYLAPISRVQQQQQTRTTLSGSPASARSHRLAVPGLPQAAWVSPRRQTTLRATLAFQAARHHRPGEAHHWFPLACHCSSVPPPGRPQGCPSSVRVPGVALSPASKEYPRLQSCPAGSRQTPLTWPQTARLFVVVTARLSMPPLQYYSTDLLSCAGRPMCSQRWKRGLPKRQSSPQSWVLPVGSIRCRRACARQMVHFSCP